MSKKRKIVIALAGTVFVVMSVVLILLLRGNETFDAADIDYLCSNGVTMPLTSTSKGTYLCAPSFEKTDRLNICLKENFTGMPVSVNGQTMTPGEPMEVYPTSKGQILFECGRKSLSVTVMASANVPSVFITTESGVMTNVNADKEYKEGGTFVLTDPQGNELVSDELKHITGRGNQTWRYEKKPYNIKLDDSADLLGMGKSKEWCLIANYLDVSGMRNKMVYDFAKELGFAYTPECEYVDLWLNGRYAGMYLLTEKVEIDSDRLDIYDLEKNTEALNGELSRFEAIETDEYRCYDIKNDPVNIQEGFLIEYENEQRYKNEASWFKLRDGTTFTVKSPEYVSEAQMEYLRTYVQSVVDALDAEDGIDPLTGKKYSELMDMESFAKKYIVEEFSGNKDSEWSSQYYYLSEGKLYAGPVWDYDHTFGNGGAPLENPETLIAGWRTTYKELPAWYGRMLEKEDFYSLMCDIYVKEARPVIAELAKNFYETRQRISSAAAMNDTRWYSGTENEAAADRDHLIDYVLDRTEFLDRLWIEKEEMVYVYFIGVGVEQYYSYMVTPGTTLEQIADTGLGFSVADSVVVEIGGGVVEDTSLPITENSGYYVTLRSDTDTETGT